MSDSKLSVMLEPSNSAAARWARLTDRELVWCLRFHQAVQQRWAVRLFAVVSPIAMRARTAREKLMPWVLH